MIRLRHGRSVPVASRIDGREDSVTFEASFSTLGVIVVDVGLSGGDSCRGLVMQAGHSRGVGRGGNRRLRASIAALLEKRSRRAPSMFRGRVFV